jgi:hypothetical protein
MEVATAHRWNLDILKRPARVGLDQEFSSTSSRALKKRIRFSSFITKVLICQNRTPAGHQEAAKVKEL